MNQTPPIDQGSVDAERQTIKLNKWGLSSVGLIPTGFAAWAVCQRLINDKWNVCIVPHILLQLTAVAFGIVAARRGSKWWLLASLFALGLAIQAFLALAVE